MLKQGDRITNARTGQILIFLKTGKEMNGKLLQIECISPPRSLDEPEHIHPFQQNSFEIVSGILDFSIDGDQRIAEPGEVVIIPPNVPHFFRNAGKTEAQFIQEFKPALHIDSFFETSFALSRDGKLNKKGIPNLIHGSLIMLKYKNEIRVTNLPWVIQYLIYLALSPVGKLMGYSADYGLKTQ
jgi:quercetin dioxygenase-like cupin family protein